MSIFNSFGAMSGQFAAKQERNQVARAFAEELQLPGALASLLDTLRRGPMKDELDKWISASSATTATDLQLGLKGSDLLAKLAQRTSMPLGVIKSSFSALLPLAIQHLATHKYILPDFEVDSKPLPGTEELVKAIT